MPNDTSHRISGRPAAGSLKAVATHIVEGIYQATLSWLTDPKFEVYYRNLKYVGHVWAIGVVYVREGEWDRIFLLTG